MANDVLNILKVSGDPQEMEAMFKAIIREEVGLGSIDFKKIVPEPDDIYHGPVGKEAREKYGKHNWYDWRLENWGVKWNSYYYDPEHVTEDFNGREIKFCTPWGAPIQVIEALAKKYPELKFEFGWSEECLIYEAGQKIYENGAEIYSYIPESETLEVLDLSAKILDMKRTDETYIRELAGIINIDAVFSELSVSGDPQMIEKMFDDIQNEEEGLGSIDFNKIIPVPKDIYDGSLEKAAIEKNNNNLSEWLKDNWGVQKSIYGSYIPFFLDNAMWIVTLGGVSLQIFDALAKNYPDLIFELEWGYNMGKYGYGQKRYENGIEVYSYIPEEDSDEACELADKIARS